MLRQSQLPPRAPVRSKEIIFSSDESIPTNPLQKSDVSTRHKKSLSHSAVLEDQPAWMDDLLSDFSSTPGRFHSRSSSDSVAFLDDLDSQSMLLSHNDDENATSDGSGGTLESACIYGPNSPRRKLNEEFMGSSVLTALSDCASRAQLHFLPETSCNSWPRRLDSWGNSVGSIDEMNAEAKAEKRHPRQRSRVRKLQYIAELERTVNALQAFESELQYKLSTLLQQRLTLSVENSKLKQHMSTLQHKKLFLDSEYQMLQREAERLRSGLARLPSHNNKVLPHPNRRSNRLKPSEDKWEEMLDWAKLNLG